MQKLRKTYSKINNLNILQFIQPDCGFKAIKEPYTMSFILIFHGFYAII